MANKPLGRCSGCKHHREGIHLDYVVGEGIERKWTISLPKFAAQFAAAKQSA